MDILSVQKTTSTTGKYVANPGGGVMMQAFIGCPSRRKLVE
jgi:hypothetical protein